MDKAHDDRYVTLEVARTETGVSDSTLRRWLKHGEISGHKIPTPRGQAWQVNLSEVRSICALKGMDTHKPDKPDVLDAAPSSELQPGQNDIHLSRGWSALADELVRPLVDSLAQAERRAGSLEQRCAELEARLAEARRPWWRRIRF